MRTEFYDFLPDDCINIRTEVFINEQEFKDEFDDIEDIAVHMVVFDKDKAIACGRLYPSSKDESCFHIGRIAVTKDYRGKGLGAFALKSLEAKAKELGGKTAQLSAQVQAQGFYEKQGYIATGDVYKEEHCPHILMTKKL